MNILTKLDDPKWIASSEQEYLGKAVALASDPQKLSTICQNLRAEMKASPLMDQKGFVVNSKVLIKPCGKNGVLLKWYYNCKE